MYLDEEGKQKDRTFCYMELSLVDAIVVRQTVMKFHSYLMTIICLGELHVVVNPTLCASVSV